MFKIHKHLPCCVFYKNMWSFIKLNTVYICPPDESAIENYFSYFSKDMVWVLKRNETRASMSSLEYTKHLFKLIGKKIITFLR